MQLTVFDQLLRPVAQPLVRFKTDRFNIYAYTCNGNVAQFKLIFSKLKPKLSLLCSPMNTVFNFIPHESLGFQTRFYDGHVAFGSFFIAVNIVQ